MANPTTHVIELQQGIGEPAFIPLSSGQELAPISVGRKGMWRIESARVADVHAFVYFDGAALFIQSADDSSPVVADGEKIGKNWTELQPPCQIDVGAARLFFRSLVASEDETVARPNPPPPVPAQRPPTPPPAAGRAAETIGPRGRSAPPPPVPAAPPAPAPPRPPAARTGAQPAAPAQPTGERPFAPGSFSSRDEDESTRFAPVGPAGPTVRSARGPATGGPMAPTPVPPMGSGGYSVPPAAQSGMQQAMMQQPGTMPHAMPPQPNIPPGMDPQMMQPGMMQPGMMQPGMMQPGMMQPGMMQPGMMQPGMMQPGMMQPGMMQPGMMQPGSMPPQFTPSGVPGSQMGSYPGGTSYPGGQQPMNVPMPVGQAPPKKDGMQEAIEQFKAASPPKKILIAISPLVIFAAIYLLLFDDDPAPRRKVVATNPSASVSSVVPVPGIPPTLTATPVPPTVLTAPPTVPVPPTAPLTAPVPPTVATGPTIPTVTVATAPVPPPPTVAVPVPPTATAPPSASVAVPPPIASLPAGQRTTERQAVDAMAAGDFQRAVQLYTQLSQSNPNNRAYAEAARILKSRLAENR